MSPIEQKFQELKDSGWWPGEPLHEERRTPCGRGLYRTYKQEWEPDPYVSIHWTSTTGAHETHGGIRAKWAELGFENHYLGFPISDEQDYTEKNSRGEDEIKGVISFFEGGAIIWYRDTNTRVVLKRINNEILAVDEREKTPLDIAERIAKVSGKLLKAFLIDT